MGAKTQNKGFNKSKKEPLESNVHSFSFWQTVLEPEVECSLNQGANGRFRKWDNTDRLYAIYERAGKHLSAIDIIEQNNLNPDDTMKFLLKITEGRENIKFIDEITRDKSGRPDPSKSADVVR